MIKDFSNYYTSDLETTNIENDCRVWAWGLCNIESKEFFNGTNLNEFFEFLLSKKNNCICYFHNLKFDMEFILYYLFLNGFIHVEDQKYLEPNTFTTLISESNLF